MNTLVQQKLLEYEAKKYTNLYRIKLLSEIKLRNIFTRTILTNNENDFTQKKLEYLENVQVQPINQKIKLQLFKIFKHFYLHFFQNNGELDKS